MPRRKDHTREELKAMALAAAIDILCTQGAAEFSIRNIARHMGYTVGTLYNVFENFNDLVLQLNAQTMEAMYIALKGIDDIHALAQAYIEFAHTHAPQWCLLFESKIGEQARPEWYLHKIQRLFNLVEQALLPSLNNSSAEAVITAKVFWASLYGICMLSITGKVNALLGETAQTLARSLVENYLRGLRTDNL